MRTNLTVIDRKTASSSSIKWSSELNVFLLQGREARAGNLNFSISLYRKTVLKLVHI